MSVKHIRAINTIATVISIGTGNIALCHRTNLASSVARDLGQCFRVKIEEIVILSLLALNTFYTFY